MSSALDVSILVRIVDQVTEPLRILQRAFEQFAGLSGKVSVLGAAVAAISFMPLIDEAAAFDQQLRDMTVMSGRFGQQAENHIRQVKGELFDLGIQTGLTAGSLAAAREQLTSSGMEDAAASGLLSTIARAAKAASAVPEDVARAALAMGDSFGIAADQMEANLGRLVAAGKLGRFEFKDMTKVLPDLAAGLGKLGVTGEEAVATLGASLQVAMFGADNTSTAASNFKTFLSRVLSPEARKAFEAMGVDISSVMTGASATGANPMEAVIDKMSALAGIGQPQIDAMMATAKGKGLNDRQAADETARNIKAILGRSQLGQALGDGQVQDFLVSYLMNREKYEEFKTAIKAAGLDEMSKDFNTQMQGLGTQYAIFGQIIDVFEDRIGVAFGENLGWINAGLITLLSWVRMVDAAFPGLIDQVLTFGGGALMLVAGLGALVPVFSVISAGIGVVTAVIGALVPVFSVISAGIGALTAGLGALVPVSSVISAGMGALTAGLGALVPVSSVISAGMGVVTAVMGAVLTPVGLLVAAFVAAAAIIYSDWENFAPFFSRIWDGVTQAASAAVKIITALFSGDWAGAGEAGAQFLSGLGQIGAGLLSVLGRLGSIIGNWAMSQLPESWRQAAEQAGTALGAAATMLGESLAALANGAGQAWDTIKAKASEAWDGVKAMMDRLSRWSGEDWANLGTSVANSAMGWGAQMVAAGGSLITGIMDGAKAQFETLKTWFSTLPSRLREAVGNVDLRSMFNWWPGGSAAPAGANDNVPAANPVPGPQSFAPVQGRQMADAGFAPPGSMGAWGAAGLARPAEVSGRIVVEAAPGTHVREAESDTPSVSLVAGTGRVVGRV